jgi:DNA polymerase-4
VLIGIIDRVTQRMRKAQRSGRTVMLRLRFDDFTRASRSHTLPQATAETRAILDTARELLAGVQPLIARQGLTLVGVSVANLQNDEYGLQLALPLDLDTTPLDAALDAVRERFGPNAVTRAVLLGRDQGLVVPLLPD